MGGTGPVTATISSFANGATATFKLVVKINANLANNTTITNTATVTSDTTDSNTANNSATQTTTVVIPPPPLTFFVAVDANNNLLRFKNSAPNVITSTTPITGLQAGEFIEGIDRRPATGQLYAVSNQSRLYTINLVT